MLALLFVVALLGVGMAALGTVWQTAAQREKEAELLFVGDQFRRAIESYYRRTPGPDKQLPKSLAELVQDNRFPMPVRHLRRVYADPLTGDSKWGLVRDEKGGILAVHSLAEGTPLKTAGFPPTYLAFAEAHTYRDWVFKAAIEEQAAQAGSTFVQGPEEGYTPGRVTPPAPVSPTETASQNRGILAQCEASRQASLQDCQTLREEGDEGGWKQCMDEVGMEFQRCLSRR